MSPNEQKFGPDGLLEPFPFHFSEHRLQLFAKISELAMGNPDSHETIFLGKDMILRGIWKSLKVVHSNTVDEAADPSFSS